MPIEIAYEWKAKGTKEMAGSNSKEIKEIILNHADNVGNSGVSKEASKKALMDMWTKYPKILIACYMEAAKAADSKEILKSNPGELRKNNIKNAFFACLQEDPTNGEYFLTKLLENQKIKKWVARIMGRKEIYNLIKAQPYNPITSPQIAQFLLKTNNKAAYSKAEDFINHTLTKKIAKEEYPSKQEFARKIDKLLYKTRSTKIKDKKTLLVRVSGFARRHPLKKILVKILNALRKFIPAPLRAIYIGKDLSKRIKTEINKIGRQVAGESLKRLRKQHTSKRDKTNASSAPNRNASVRVTAIGTLSPIARNNTVRSFTSPSSTITSPSASPVSTSPASSTTTSPSASPVSTSPASSTTTSPSASLASNSPASVSLNSSILSSLTSPSASTASNSPASISHNNNKVPPVDFNAVLAVSLFANKSSERTSGNGPPGEASFRDLEQSF